MLANPSLVQDPNTYTSRKGTATTKLRTARRVWYAVAAVVVLEVEHMDALAMCEVTLDTTRDMLTGIMVPMRHQYDLNRDCESNVQSQVPVVHVVMFRRLLEKIKRSHSVVVLKAADAPRIAGWLPTFTNEDSGKHNGRPERCNKENPLAIDDGDELLHACHITDCQFRRSD